MDYGQMMEQIRTKHLTPVYLLTGEESFLHRRVEQALIEASVPPEEQKTNVTILEQDIPKHELCTLLLSVPFFSTQQVVVIRNTNLFRAAKTGGSNHAPGEKKNRLLQETLQNLPEESRIVFSTPQKVDQRTALFKTIRTVGTVVELPSPRPNDIHYWVARKMDELDKKMTPDAERRIMASLTGMEKVSLETLDSELTKVALYAGARQQITAADVAAVFLSGDGYSAFTFADSMGQKNVLQTLQLLRQLLASGEYPLKIIMLMERQIRLLWQVKQLQAAGRAQREIATELAIPLFVVRKLNERSRSLSVERLRKALLALDAAGMRMKNGMTSGAVDLEQIVIELAEA